MRMQWENILDFQKLKKLEILKKFQPFSIFDSLHYLVVWLKFTVYYIQVFEHINGHDPSGAAE